MVTSGAVATARINLKIQKPSTLPQKQALSSVGQVMLMEKYSKELNEHGINIGQILLTKEDIATLKSLNNLKTTLETMREMLIFPIINENDAIATNEIKISDNDTLSAHVAKGIGANLLIILTDVDGIFDKNPKKHPNAKLIFKTGKMQIQETDEDSNFGSGGITTKIKAGNIGIENGFDVIIANGRKLKPISSILEGKCTIFKAN